MRLVTALFLSFPALLLTFLVPKQQKALLPDYKLNVVNTNFGSGFNNKSGYTRPKDGANREKESFVVTDGSMPAKPLIDANGITIVYGIGDSLMMVTGKDIRNLAQPELIAVVPKMFSHAMRGPQAVKTPQGIVITVCTEEGNIFCFSKNGNKWVESSIINKPETAKEGLSALANNGDNLIAIWLNVKQPKGQSLYASRSSDAGAHWSVPYQIYDSPDGTICECCKPSVVQQGEAVFVMFRNWINGNRDMHLLKSINGGKSFGKGERIGTGNWPLNGCPMDGGDIVVNDKGEAATIWRRAGNIYSSVSTGNEQPISTGKNGSIETDGSNTFLTWTDQGRVMVQDASGRKIDYGPGTLPLLRKMNDHKMLCIWQRDNKIIAAII